MPALSAVARHEYYAELGNALPPPVQDKPEYRQRRITTAVEAFESLRPGDAYEARLAVQIVLSGAHAADSPWVETGPCATRSPLRTACHGGGHDRSR
ncbi:MAG TPA: hypothetical protein VGL95_04485 [Acetobacteraceae bacterium]|jgi:hypothetical protein